MIKDQNYYQLDAVQLGSILMSVKAILSFSLVIPYPDWIDYGIISVALFCFVFGILQQKYSLKILIAYLFITFLSLYTCILIKNYALVITVITVITLRTYNFRKFLQTILSVEKWLCVFHIVYSIGYSLIISPDTFLANTDGRIRFTFGFVHPNVFSLILFGIILIDVWLNYHKNPKAVIVKAVLIQFFAFIFADSRTSLLTFGIFLLLIGVERYDWGKKSIKLVTSFIFPVLSAVMYLFIVSFVSNQSFAVFFNKILNSRIRLGAYAYDKFGITWFGQRIDYSVTWDAVWKLNSFTFDNIYSYLMVSVGIIWIFMLSLLFFLVSKRLNAFELIFLIIWALYGMTEVIILNGYYCFPVFILVEVLKTRSSNINLREGYPCVKNQRKLQSL